MSLLEVSISLSFFLGLMFLTYVCILVRNFLRYRPGKTGDPADFSWHFIVPCRDEESVIGTTLEYLTERFPLAHAWVVDDHSEDRTAEIIAEYAERDPRVHLLSRRLPDARRGKGDALNAGYQAISDWVPADTPREQIVVCVVDADGRPGPNLMEVCAGPDSFGDQTIGAIQVEVRMINRAVRHPLPDAGPVGNRFASLLARMQDIEFRGPISAMQLTRRITGTVNMGGNGQLIRLTALDDIAGTERCPWGNALLEDFEIGLRLMLAGWRTAYTPAAWVDQEALWNLQALLVQRTRWAHGSMQCVSYLRHVWASRHFSTAGFLEIMYFMIQPWVQVLGSVVFFVPIAAFAYNAATYRSFMDGFLLNGGLLLLTLYVVLGIGEFAVWGWIYRRRCEPEISRRAAFGYGVSMAFYSVANFVIAWRAFLRVLARRDSWRKTRRNIEIHQPQPAATRVAEAAAEVA